MNSHQSVPSDDSPNAAQAMAMLEDLRSSGVIRFKLYWRAYLAAILYGCVAWWTGPDFFTVYLCLLVVVFFLHDISRRRTQVQIDLILVLLKKYERNESHDSTSKS